MICIVVLTTRSPVFAFLPLMLHTCTCFFLIITVYCNKNSNFWTCDRTCMQDLWLDVWVLPYSLPSIVPVYMQSVSRWLLSHLPVRGCHYFPPDLRSSSQPKNNTVLRPVPSYAAWWQKHIGVNNLPKFVTQLCPGVNWKPTTHWSQVQRLTAMPLRQQVGTYRYSDNGGIH